MPSAHLLEGGAPGCLLTALKAPRPVPHSLAWSRRQRQMDWNPTLISAACSNDFRTPRRSKISRPCCRSAHSISHRNDGGELPLTLRLSAHPRDVATGGLAGEQEACATVVSLRGPAASNAHPTSKAYVLASRCCASGATHARALE